MMSYGQRESAVAEKNFEMIKKQKQQQQSLSHKIKMFVVMVC